MMDKKRKNKLEELKKRQKPPVIPVLADGKDFVLVDSKSFIDSLELKLVKFSEAIDTPVTIDNIDELLNKLSIIPSLAESVSSLSEAIKDVKTPEYPDKIELKGISEVISLFKQNDSKKLISDNATQIKSIIQAVQNLSNAIEKNKVKQRPEDYLPYRRVVKVGNALVFDDNPSSSGGRSGGTPTIETADGTAVPIANPDGSSIGTSGGATEVKQDSQITLATQLETLTETLQELVQRLAPLAGAINNTASLRITPISSVSTAVTGSVTATGGGYITSAQSIAEKAVAGISYPEKVAITNLTAVQSNINNAIAA